MKKILYYFAFCLSLASFVACEDSSSASDEITSSDSSSSVFDRMSSDHEPKSSSASDEIASSVSSSSAADEMGFDHEPDESGKIHFDDDNPALGYVYEDSAWRKATSLEISLGLGCVESTNGLYVGTSFADYVCDAVVEHSWKQARVMEIDKKYFFNDGIEYGSVEDERDGHVYKTVEINGMTWMAENLSYFVEKAECKDSLTIGCIYAWDAALNMSEGERLQEVNQGICMAGWHVPDTTEWYKLLGNRPLDDFKSEVGWKKGSNATGFSAVPISYSPIISISMGGSYRDMNSATFITLNKGFKMPPIDDALVIGNVAVFDVDAFRVNPATADRTLSFSFESYPKGALRCVKDGE